MAIYEKDPDAVLDFSFDWSDWLADGETISTYVVTVADGLTKDSDAQASGVVTHWLSGGTVGTNYSVACKVTTNQGRTDERTDTICIRQR